MDIRRPAARPGTIFLILGLAAAAPAFTASLSFTGDPQPLPEASSRGASPLAIESWAAGSATLVPLMAADTQAAPQDANANVDAPASTQAVGKPIDDVSFVRRATESGRKEIASAREAVPQLRSPELKRMAEMLVQDHTAANAKLSKIAETKGWPLPAPQAAAAPPPEGAAGGSFDDKWTAEMIAGHERSVALYRAQAQGGKDQDLRKYAGDTLPTIEHHLAELKKLQK